MQASASCEGNPNATAQALGDWFPSLPVTPAGSVKKSMSPRRIAKLLAWSGTVALATVLLVAVWVVHHRTANQAMLKAIGVLPGALLHAHNFHWTQMKGDHKQWELDAGEASYSEDKTWLNLRGAELTMVAEDGKRVSVIAPRAALRMEGNRVSRAELSGGLRVHYGEVVVNTEHASFIPDADELDAPGPVTVEAEGLKVSGIGLVAHPRRQVFVLGRDVSTEVIPKGRGEAQKPGPAA